MHVERFTNWCRDEVYHYKRSKSPDIDTSSLISPTWVILSPGQGDSAESFLPLFESSVNHNINMVVFDPPGHGLSDEPLTDYSVCSQRIIWESVLDYLTINRAYIGDILMGHIQPPCVVSF